MTIFGSMKVLFQHRGKVIRRDAELVLVVSKGVKKSSVEAFIDGKTSEERDTANFLRVLHLASATLLDEDSDRLEVL